MNEILNAISSFPGVVPTILLGVLLVFGLLALLGALDIHHVGSAEWGLDLNHDGHSDGPEIFAALGFGRVPIFVIASAIGVPWWILTVAAQLFIAPRLPQIAGLPGWIAGAVLLGLSFAVALRIAISMVRPLKPVFADRGEGARTLDFVGRACKIVTGSVDESFGQADVPDVGAPHRLQVYARTPNTLVRGSAALILSYDAHKKKYEVEAYDA
jgi:hypothetical protein